MNTERGKVAEWIERLMHVKGKSSAGSGKPSNQQTANAGGESRVGSEKERVADEVRRREQEHARQKKACGYGYDPASQRIEPMYGRSQDPDGVVAFNEAYLGKNHR